MGVLKTLTDEYFGDSIRKEDDIDISDLDVEIVSFKDNNGTFHGHGYRVKDNNDIDEIGETLRKLIERLIKKRGKNCNLNDIDVSNIKSMYFLENKYTNNHMSIFEYMDFNGDVSGWDVSKVENMNRLFSYTTFDGDLSKWNVQNVKKMNFMFSHSNFSGKNGIFKLKKGNKLIDMISMFEYSNLEVDISDWDVSRVKDMTWMFFGTSLIKNNNLPQWYLDRMK